MILSDNCQIHLSHFLCLEIRMLYGGFSNGEPNFKCLTLSSAEVRLHIRVHTILISYIYKWTYPTYVL